MPIYQLFSFNLLDQTKSPFFRDRLFIILAIISDINCNSKHGFEKNINFLVKIRETMRPMNPQIKVLAIFITKKQDYYCQNNNEKSKLLLIMLN